MSISSKPKGEEYTFVKVLSNIDQKIGSLKAKEVKKPNAGLSDGGEKKKLSFFDQIQSIS